jgi:hypothetical protein
MIKGLFIANGYTITHNGQTASGKFDVLTAEEAFPKFNNLGKTEEESFRLALYMSRGLTEMYDESGNFGSLLADREKILGGYLSNFSEDKLKAGFMKDRQTYKVDGNRVFYYDKDGKEDTMSQSSVTKLENGLLTRTTEVNGSVMTYTYGELDKVIEAYKKLHANADGGSPTAEDNATANSDGGTPSQGVGNSGTAGTPHGAPTDGTSTGTSGTGAAGTSAGGTPNGANTATGASASGSTAAKPTIELDKEEYERGDQIIVTIKGVTEKNCPSGCPYLAMYTVGADTIAPGEDTMLPMGTSTHTFYTDFRNKSGDYEISLHDGYGTDSPLLAKVPFKIVSE